jgi:hypothetical protein
MSGEFSIAGVVDNATMMEDPPGIYTGEYVVADGTNIVDATVIVRLTDAVGNVGINTSQQVTIDTTVPEVSMVSVAGSPAKSGEAIEIIVVGEPGVSVQFFIAGVAENVPMSETAGQPGTYTGTYSVVDGVDVTDAVVTAILTDNVGNISVDTSQRVTIDTTIPEIASVSVSGDPARTGETITVTAIGEAGGTGQFTIAGVVEDVPMTEDAESHGTYTGTYTVMDDDPCVTDAVLTVTLEDVAGNVASDTSGQVTMCPSWDVNADGSVDASDLTAIGMSFGQDASEGDSADVNRDGRVDLLDLIIVCKHFGATTIDASPTKGAVVVAPEQLAVLRRLYESIDGSDDDLIMAKRLLAELIGLPAIQITRSRLMQNYPNPCNPETWLPYELAEPGTVIISIYTSAGQLVRTLDLGYRAMGSYSSRSKAAHWDGTNEAGEMVSSGLYFCTIKSGDFSAVRKLIVSR